MKDRVTEYAKKVVSGKVVAGQLHILACKRHLDDLEKQNTEDFPYHWDPKKSNRILDFAETLTKVEGEKATQVKLEDFQAFDIGCRFGWLNEKNKRRFRRSYISEARQNGKSFINGITGTYIAGFCKYKYGKLFTAATKKRQAKITWDEMVKFIKADSDLSEKFIITEYKSLITNIDTECTIEALSKESGLDDGFRAIFVSLDELHQHKNNKMYKALYNGTKSLLETLVSMITTRGDKLNSFCYEMDSYCVSILHGISIAVDFFVDIYTLDEGDDIFDPKNYIKANPYLARTPDGLKQLIIDANTARDMGGSDLRDFITKSLNMWCRNTDDQYIDPEKLKKCATSTKLDVMRGKKCFIGLDLSSGGDLTSLALEFPLDDDRFYLYTHSFMPKGRLEEHIETDLAPYDVWEDKGLITVTGGKMTFKNDYKFIVKHLKEIIEEYELKPQGCGYDPHNADGFIDDLEELGCPLLEVTQSARNLNDATVDMRLNIKSEKIEYDQENELFSWSFLNASTVENSFGEIKIDKKVGDKTKRIDPIDAAIDAHYAYQKLCSSDEIDPKEELEKYLKIMGLKKEGE